MRLHTVKHQCGHEGQYRLGGGRVLVGHHLHELERSPCTPCAERAAAGRQHIYLGAAVRVVAFPTAEEREVRQRAPARRVRRGAA